MTQRTQKNIHLIDFSFFHLSVFFRVLCESFASSAYGSLSSVFMRP
jgi:hypothetical protein